MKKLIVRLISFFRFLFGLEYKDGYFGIRKNGKFNLIMKDEGVSCMSYIQYLFYRIKVCWFFSKRFFFNEDGLYYIKKVAQNYIKVIKVF